MIGFCDFCARDLREIAETAEASSEFICPATGCGYSYFCDDIPVAICHECVARLADERARTERREVA